MVSTLFLILWARLVVDTSVLPDAVPVNNGIAAQILNEHNDTTLTRVAALLSPLNLPAPNYEARRCFAAYRQIPRRSNFFSRIPQPPNMPVHVFHGLLARGGIHPRGVILDSEFILLPVRCMHHNVCIYTTYPRRTRRTSKLRYALDSTRRLCARSLLRWEVCGITRLRKTEPKGSVAYHRRQINANESHPRMTNSLRQKPSLQMMLQVVSSHLRLIAGSKDLIGPFKAVDERLARSPYIRKVLSAFGSVLGNVAFMALEPGARVEPHFDTNKYWYPRVRVHLPVATNDQVRGLSTDDTDGGLLLCSTFSCIYFIYICSMAYIYIYYIYILQ